MGDSWRRGARPWTLEGHVGIPETDQALSGGHGALHWADLETQGQGGGEGGGNMGRGRP